MTVAMERTTPEAALMAILHQVGPDIKLVDDFPLAEVFNDAATQYKLFRPFAWHPHYHVSEVLSESLQLLDQAGSIVRENAAQTYFRASAHVAGPYGESIFSSLDADQQAAVKKVADRIKEVFGHKNEPSGAD